jgi:NADP-dependent 3-hydroxy acid dehydrogenase YdfG
VTRRPRNAFITGASGGLGAALARLYAAQGGSVGLFARRQEELVALAASFPEGRIAVYTGDVRDARALE